MIEHKRPNALPPRRMATSPAIGIEHATMLDIWHQPRRAVARTLSRPMPRWSWRRILISFTIIVIVVPSSRTLSSDVGRALGLLSKDGTPHLRRRDGEDTRVT
jgi:hypothetical protein